jgi:hypothetical protein|tara:strand:+ start:195 stop:722 length:528 start_codon:yes stop_codon:yes gene_type:complete
MLERWRLNNLDYDLDKLQSHINEINNWSDSPFSWPIKDSKWVDVSETLDINLINVVENTINTTIKKNNYWLWYYNTSKVLKPHLDKKFNGCKYSIIVPIVGDFELTAYIDHNNLYNWVPGVEEDIDVDQLTVVDKISYRPGQFLLLNNTVYPHGGISTETNRITLHLYLEDNNYE